MANTWMRHTEHGGVAQLPDTEAWRARGWTPCEPPEEPDPTREPAAPQTISEPPLSVVALPTLASEETDDNA